MKTAFLDSNILLYAISERRQDRRKQEIAKVLLESYRGTFIVSVQVLNEFLNIATLARKHDLTRAEADHLRKIFENELIVHNLTQVGYEIARDWYLTDLLSLWDSLIVASANLAGCDTLYSEDMKDGETYGKVTIVNPFVDL